MSDRERFDVKQSACSPQAASNDLEIGTTDAARTFRLLALHPGPEFGAEGAAALTGMPVARTRRVLDALVGAHLVGEQAAGRYRLHDLLRAYAADQARSEDTTGRRG